VPARLGDKRPASFLTQHAYCGALCSQGCGPPAPASPAKAEAASRSEIVRALVAVLERRIGLIRLDTSQASAATVLHRGAIARHDGPPKKFAVLRRELRI
jgi:hypothetical protein